MDRKELKSISFKCKGCGSTLRFSPSLQNLKCPSCEKVEVLEKVNTNKKHELSEAKEVKHESWINTSKMMRCQTCGAEIILNKLEFSSVCPYCGSSYVSKVNELPDFLPDKVIPFSFDEVEAGRRFKLQIKRKFYVPSSCKKNVKPENIIGTYIPAFSFDSNIKSEYNGVLRRKDENNENEYFTISGKHNSLQIDVIEENSSKITQGTLKKILPYNFSGAYDFSEGFLLGYVVEHYEDAFNVCLNKAKKEMEQKVRQEILSKYTYDGVKEFNMKCEFFNQKYQYMVLPIYQMNFFYRNKNYNIIMNGQSGKVGGKFPTSVLKVLFTIFGWLLVIALIVVLSTLS